MRAAPAIVLSAVLTAALTPVSGWAAPPVHFPASAGPGAGALPFSASVLAGDTLYLSGSLDLDPATGRSPPDPEAAARQVLHAVKQSVEAAGLTMDDLVQVQVFCTDMSLYGPFNAVYRTYFTGPPPARAFIGVSQLANGARLEVMGVAVRR